MFTCESLKCKCFDQIIGKLSASLCDVKSKSYDTLAGSLSYSAEILYNPQVAQF